VQPAALRAVALIHKHEYRLVGSSDLRGTIEEDPGQERPMVTADLTSTKIDLAGATLLTAEPWFADSPLEESGFELMVPLHC
jgi:hypothetical protein